MGRPTKFTPDRRERFLAALRLGAFPETAARHAGWSPATLYRILAGTSPTHLAFQDDVRRVETELELRLAGTVTHASFTDPRLALTLLERRFAARWGRRAAVLTRADERSADEAASRDGVVVLEPALIEAVIPVLLEARAGPAGSDTARKRVDQFRVPVGRDDDG